MSRIILFILLICIGNVFAQDKLNIPILTYHDFHPSKSGSMTINTEKLTAQLEWLKQHGYTFITLREAVDYLEGKRASLPPKPVVVTADDGRVTVYRYLLPIVEKYHVPVTLFIYPSCISRTSYALTWEQLKALEKTGLFDIQSHTYWHPNFDQERKHLSAHAYQTLVHDQLIDSKKTLEKKLGIKITLLAWPYGVYNHYLEEAAAKAGYEMAFSVDDRSANQHESKMAMPRFVILNKYSMKTFIHFVNS
ncbi:MAG: polysaccharide deacetylase family protein [Gammaproteobacteria bacterium]|nr:polysaccharide deacetylase family protein [Gammaproteobacteria bacterium]